MKMIGIGVVIIGGILLAGNAFEFYKTAKYVPWIPVGLGILIMMMGEAGQGA